MFKEFSAISLNDSYLEVNYTLHFEAGSRAPYANDGHAW